MSTASFRSLKKLFLFMTICFLANAGQAAIPVGNVIGLQRFATSSSATFTNSAGSGSARLINLNPGIGIWYVLEVQWPGRSYFTDYHLEWSGPIGANVILNSHGLTISSNNTVLGTCDVFTDQAAQQTLNSDGSGYSPLCQTPLAVRHHQHGSPGGWQEWGANLLRNHGLGSIVNWYKEWIKGHDTTTAKLGKNQGANQNLSGGPRIADVNPAYASKAMWVPNLDIALKDGVAKKGMLAGQWYPLKYQKHVYFSSIEPAFVSQKILNSGGDAAPLNSYDRNSLAYLVAFPLDKYTAGWSHGSRLPGVGWSHQFSYLINNRLAGPDGFSTLNPLQMNGILNPVYIPRLAATMCGGFQRYHGIFPTGPFRGLYFGFLQEGVVLSRLNPGLATFIVYKNGDVTIKTWTQKDQAQIENIRYARQNGAPIEERNAAGETMPGALVNQWAAGAWSGALVARDGHDWNSGPGVVVHSNYVGLLNSQRAAACIAHNGKRRFLIYSYFTDDTPSAMARVFQAYHCDYAIHLDMNSAGQGYLGLFSKTKTGYVVEHPVNAMAARDGTLTLNGVETRVPRYVGKPDQADFFYILRKH